MKIIHGINYPNSETLFHDWKKTSYVYPQDHTGNDALIHATRLFKETLLSENAKYVDLPSCKERYDLFKAELERRGLREWPSEPEPDICDYIWRTRDDMEINRGTGS